MTGSDFDVLCIGNAIVDVIARVEEGFVSRHGLVKGSMNLIDEARAEQLYADMGQAIEVSGGSAGNTAAGIASLGGKAAYFGKVKADQLGAIFRHDMRAQGVSIRHAARHRRARHGAILHSGHARQRAHHEHLSRRLRELHRRRTSTRGPCRPRR